MENRSSLGFAVLVVVGCSTGPLSGPRVAGVLRASMTPDELVESYRSQFQVPVSSQPGPGSRGSVEARPALAASSVDHFDETPAGIQPVFSPKADLAKAGLKVAEVILPARAGEPFGLTDRESGVSVNVELLDTRPVQAVRSSTGYLVYGGAHASGATLLEMPRLDGVEDYLPFDSLPAKEQVSYRVTLKGGVAGLRLISNSLELLDREGTPRLRMNPPVLLAQDGSQKAVDVRVEGCAFDSSPIGPWNRPPVAPGSDSCLVTLSWGGASYPALLDPAWVTAGANVYKREGAAIAPVGPQAAPRSFILAAGGGQVLNATPNFSTAELFDPRTRTWSLTSPPKASTSGATATPVSDGVSWNALVVGGLNVTGLGETGFTQEYQYLTGTWVGLVNQNLPARAGQSAIFDSPNNQLIVAGGENCPNNVNCAALNDVWTLKVNPLGQQWNQMANNMPTARAGATAGLVYNTILRHNEWLIVEGSFAADQMTSDLFDMVTQTWFPAGFVPALALPHGNAPAGTTLADSRFLYTGGLNTPNAAQIYDPSRDVWLPVKNMLSNRTQHTLSISYVSGLNGLPLPSQQVLAAGGDLGAGGARGGPNTSEYYDPASNTWSPGPGLTFPRYGATAVANNNTTFLVGGSDAIHDDNDMYTLALSTVTPAAVLTQHYDSFRSGVNPTETALNITTVNQADFGLVYNCPVDGNIEAQPLYVPNLVMPSDGNVHNVIFVATTNNSIYAFDADSPPVVKGQCTPLWVRSNIDPVVPTGGSAYFISNLDLLNYPNTGPGFGISSTPVIAMCPPQGTPTCPAGDGTMYFIDMTGNQGGANHLPLTTRVSEYPLPPKQPVFPGDPSVCCSANAATCPCSGPNCNANGCTQPDQYAFNLYAIDIQTGKTLLGPVPIAGTATGAGDLPDCPGGACTFTVADEYPRPGLALAGSDVIVSFGGPGDNAPWHGWVFAYTQSALKQDGNPILLMAKTDQGGAIWQGAAAPAVDSTGYVYVMTGNGDYDGKWDFGDSLVKMRFVNGQSWVQDWFTPFDQAVLGGPNPGPAGGNYDNDLGSAGPVLWSDLVFAAGKEGMIYRTLQSNLGGYNNLPKNPPNNPNGVGDAVLQEVLVDSNLSCTQAQGGSLNAQPVIWGRTAIGDWALDAEYAYYYTWAAGSSLHQFTLTAMCGAAPCSPTNTGAITDYQFATQAGACKNGLWSALGVAGNYPSPPYATPTCASPASTGPDALALCPVPAACNPACAQGQSCINAVCVPTPNNALQQSPTLALSANGPLQTTGANGKPVSTGTGVLWAVQTLTNGTGILRAFDAMNVANELWNSNQAAGQSLGYAAKFAVPTVANGRVYVGTAAATDLCNRLPDNAPFSAASVAAAIKAGDCTQNAPVASLMVYGRYCDLVGQPCQTGSCCAGTCASNGLCELQAGQPCSQGPQCMSNDCDTVANVCLCSVSGNYCSSDSDCCQTQCNQALHGICCDSQNTPCTGPADCCTGLSCTGNPLSCQP